MIFTEIELPLHKLIQIFDATTRQVIIIKRKDSWVLKTIQNNPMLIQ